MSVDDPLVAAKQIIEAEERVKSPVQHFAAQTANWVPGYVGKALSNLLKHCWKISKLLVHTTGAGQHDFSVEKLQYFNWVFKSELERVRAKLEALYESCEQPSFWEQEWPPLLVNGMHRAEQVAEQGPN